MGAASILLCAVFLGVLVVLLGEHVEKSGAVIFAILAVGALVLAAAVVLQAENPVRVAFLGLLGLSPYLSYPIPPLRLGLTIFDLLMLAITIIAIPSMARSDRTNQLKLFPVPSFWLVLALTLPSVFMSQFFLKSVQTFVTNFLLFVFFILMIEEMRRPGGYMRIVQIFAAVAFVDSIGILLEATLHVNPAFRSKNINQILAEAGSRTSGFFQDPQKAGQWLGCIVTLLSVMIFRGRFKGYHRTKIFVVATLLISVGALILTGSRNAMVSAIAVALASVVLFNALSWGIKAVLAAIIGAALGMIRVEDILDLLPKAIASRFHGTLDSLHGRYQIWMDTWDMFASHPFQGIGLGTFGNYLLATRPTTGNYYGIGLSAGTSYVPDQPESGYLKILYEGGIASSLAVFIFVAATVIHGISVMRRGDVDARTDVLAAFSGLIVFGLTFITLFTPGDQRCAMVMLFLFAFIWARYFDTGTQTKPA